MSHNNGDNISNETINNNWYFNNTFLYFIIFFSGLAALIYELIWIRMLNLTFGVSSFAIATVISVFLLGIGLGSYYFGKKAETINNILKTYAFIELSIGIFSILSFLILKYANIYEFIISNIGSSENLYLLSLIRLIISIIILIIPTFLIGGTIPLIVKFLITTNKNLGSKFSTIYYINILGGVTGILLTGLVLIRQFGVWKSFSIAIIINIIIFISIIIFKKNINFQSEIHNEITEQENNQYKPIKNFLPILFFSGFIVLGFEILWMRVLINFGSGTTLSSTMILGGFLLGFSAGSFYIAKRIDKMLKPLKNFVIYSFLTGLTGALIIFLFGQLNTFLSAQFSTYARLLLESWLGLIFAFIIAAISGTLFPLGLRLYAGNKESIGIKTGKIYFINSIGTVLGSLVTGFIFIPFFGIKISGIILIMLCFIISIYIIFKQNLNKKKLLTPAISFFIISLIFIIVSGNTFHRQNENETELFYSEGLSGTVTVLENNNTNIPYKTLYVDSQAVAGTYPSGIIDSKILAHIPILLTKNPSSVATIGYGTGGTSYSMMQYGLETYAMEIEEQVIEASKFFNDLNHGIETDPSLHIIIDDARYTLQQTNKKFDTIVTDVTNLKYKSNPYLYTVEYFQIMKDSLTPQGVGSAWVPLGGLSFNDLKILTASFEKIFPHTTIWYYNLEITSFLVLIGTPEKLSINLNDIKNKMEPVQEDLSSIYINNEYVFSSMLFLGENDVDDLVQGMQLHTDDFPILEFSDISFYVLFNPMDNLKKLLNYQKELYNTYFIMDEEQDSNLIQEFYNGRQLIHHYIDEHN
ncbi:MAG: fused MFS/spermidine synthase [Candidatus Kerfeldbacteria bacterium]